MSQANRWGDFIEADGVMIHKRWRNPDGSPKTGIELEKEQMRVELEDIASRLLDLCKRL